MSAENKQQKQGILGGVGSTLGAGVTGVTNTVGGAVGGVGKGVGDGLGAVGTGLGDTVKGVTGGVSNTTKAVGDTTGSGINKATGNKQTADNPLGLSE